MVNNKPKIPDTRKMYQPLILRASQHSPSFPGSVHRLAALVGIGLDFCGVGQLNRSCSIILCLMRDRQFE